MCLLDALQQLLNLSHQGGQSLPLPPGPPSDDQLTLALRLQDLERDHPEVRAAREEALRRFLFGDLLQPRVSVGLPQGAAGHGHALFGPGSPAMGL
jgi:hypothetical protein